MLTADTAVFTHLITLINRRTGEEKLLRIETPTNRFADVMLEVASQKVINKLQGFEIFEVLPVDEPCPF